MKQFNVFLYFLFFIVIIIFVNKNILIEGTTGQGQVSPAAANTVKEQVAANNAATDKEIKDEKKDQKERQKQCCK